MATRAIETRAKRAALIADPALIIFVLICVAGLGTVYFAGTMGVEECKAQVKAEKKPRATVLFGEPKMMTAGCCRVRHGAQWTCAPNA